MYENTQPSVTFSPNPYYGDNEEEGNNIAFSPNPYYGNGEEEEYENSIAFSPNPYYGSGNWETRNQFRTNNQVEHLTEDKTLN